LVCKLPLILDDLRHLSRANQYPLAADHLRQAPTSIELTHPCSPYGDRVQEPLAGHLLGALLVAPVRPGFSQLSLFPTGSIATLRFLSCDMSLTTLFSLTEAAVVRLLAGSASYPCPFSGLEQCPLAATYPAPGSYFDLWCRRISPSACLGFHRRAFSSRYHQPL